MANKSTYKTRINRLSGVLATLLAIVVAATILLCVGFGVYGSDVSKWFKPQNNVEQNNISDPTVINTVTEHGIALTSGEAMVASDGTLSKKLTATVTPANVEDVALDWSIAFADADSEWANGKNVTDYVTLTPSEDTLSANISLVAPFGAQIVVRATLRSDADLYAECTVDYLKRVEKIDIGFFNSSSHVYFGSDTTDREYVFGQSSRLVYKMTSDTANGALGNIGLDITYSVGTYATNRESGYPQTYYPLCHVTKIEHSQDYIDALKTTGVFKSDLTVQSLYYTDGSNSSKILSGANLPLTMLNSSSLYNEGTTLTSRRNACVTALRSMGDKPFMYITVTISYATALNSLGFTDETHVIPLYADIDSLTTFADSVSLDNNSVVF